MGSEELELAQPVAHYDLARFGSKRLRRFILEQISGEAVGKCIITPLFYSQTDK